MVDSFQSDLDIKFVMLRVFDCEYLVSNNLLLSDNLKSSSYLN